MNSAKKTKILRLIARLNIGGPAIHTVLLTSALNPLEFKTILACGRLSPGEGDMSYYAQEKGVPVLSIPALERDLVLFRDLTAFLQIYRLIAREKPGIIHTHTAKAGSLGRAAALVYNLIPWHKRVKVVHTFHGHVLSGYFSRIKSFLFIIIEKLLASSTDQLITVSQSVKDDLVRLGVASERKIAVVPLGFELKKFLDLPVSTRSSHRSVGIVGRLVPVKNHRLFIDAVSKISADPANNGISFKIVGDGEERRRLEEYAQRTGAGNIEFLGWERDLDNVYSGLDLVVLTSINEGTPVSLIEAMASGKAVVSTDVGGVRDLMGGELQPYKSSNSGFRIFERGILIEPDDKEALARAVIFLLADEGLRNRMGMSGRDYVRSQYSKERLIRDIENLYRNLR